MKSQFLLLCFALLTSQTLFCQLSNVWNFDDTLVMDNGRAYKFQQEIRFKSETKKRFGATIPILTNNSFGFPYIRIEFSLGLLNFIRDDWTIYSKFVTSLPHAVFDVATVDTPNYLGLPNELSVVATRYFSKNEIKYTHRTKKIPLGYHYKYPNFEFIQTKNLLPRRISNGFNFGGFQALQHSQEGYPLYLLGVVVGYSRRSYSHFNSTIGNPIHASSYQKQYKSIHSEFFRSFYVNLTYTPIVATWGQWLDPINGPNWKYIPLGCQTGWLFTNKNSAGSLKFTNLELGVRGPVFTQTHKSSATKIPQLYFVIRTYFGKKEVYILE